MVSPSDILHGSILIVDDQEANILLLEQMLRRAGYDRIASTQRPGDVRELHAVNRYDLILLDLKMPGTDGFQVMEALKEIEPNGYLPVLAITAEPGHLLRALQSGARDFISKPLELPEVLARVRNMLEARLLHNELEASNQVLEEKVGERTADLRDSYVETIHTVARTVALRDAYSGSHVQRISHYGRALAGILGLDDRFVETIFVASPMHDIGKMGIPDRILLNPHSLSPEEWTIMRQHAAMGSSILGGGKSPYVEMGAEIALNHHERFHGGGYPNGKRGEEIPLAARIIMVCDVYDALRSARPYKPAYDHLKTVDIMTHGDGRTQPGQFDPTILAAFAQHHQAFDEIFAANTS